MHTHVDLPCIVSGDTIAYLDPQEKVWYRQSGERYLLSELQGTDSLATLDGFEGFTSLTTNYSKTLFRFPLRTEKSDLSDCTYTASSLIKLIDVLRDEAKFLLLFLRSVHTVEVYNIASSGSKHELHLQVQVAPEFQAELYQQRATLKSELKAKHSIRKYKITPCISRVAYFAVNIKDVKNKKSMKTVPWLVASQVGSSNKEVLDAARKQCCFPWVGVAMETDSKLPSDFLSGRIFCFLPMPVETSSELSVHVNGTFGLNDDRRTIKWPGGERRNDPTAQWNQMLLTDCLPSCYNLLIHTAVEKKYVTPELFYQAWPSIDRLRYSNWNLITQPLFEILFKWKCLWSQKCKKWVGLNQDVVIIDGDDDPPDVVKTVLTACGLKVCDIPKHVSKAISHLVQHVSPNLVRKSLKNNVNAYCEECNYQKHILLRYCLLDEDYSNLDGIELLPLSDNTFIKFSRYANRCYICTQHFPRKLLPNIDNELVDLSNVDDELHSQLQKVADSSATQLRSLSVSRVASLLPKCYPRAWLHAQIVKVSKNDTSFPYEWWKVFWTWVQQQVHDLSPFEGRFIVPLVTSRKPLTMRATKLSNNSDVVVIANTESCSSTLLNAFQKLHVQFIIIEHFSKLRHYQLFDYLNRYSPSGVLEAISNSGCQVKFVSFTDAEATKIQKFLSSRNIRHLSTSHKKILQNLNIFNVLNHDRLTSVVDASAQSWNRQVIFEPDLFTLSGELLPSNMIILSKTKNKIELFQEMPSDLIAMPKTMITFLIDYLFHMILNGSCPEGKIDPLMEHVLRFQFPLLCRNQEFIACLKNLPFIPFDVQFGTSARKAPSELFDSSDTLLRQIFQNMPVFPLSPFNDSDILHYLRQCELKTNVSGQQLFEVVNQAASSQSNRPQPVKSELLTRVKAILSYIERYPAVLNDYVPKSYQHTYFLPSAQNHLSESLRTLTKNWLPVQCNPPKMYPKDLTWKGRGYNCHFVSHNNEAVLLCNSNDIEQFAMIVGSQMYFVDCPRVLCEKLSQAIPIAHVFKHLFLIIEKCKLFSSSTVDKLVHPIYEYLNNNHAQVREYCLTKDLSHHKLIWVKKHHRFATPQETVLFERSSFPYSLAPFYEVLSESLHEYLELFSLFSVSKEFSNSDIISVLGKIKNDDKGVVQNHTAWKLVEHILNWLTDSGESLAQEKLDDEALLVPIQSQPDRPLLVNVEDVVYTDLEFLKSFESDEDDTFFIHDKFAHLAVSLGVNALSTHLNVSYDAFDDVGQHEPLITRLKNILKDYKDGLTIIKELLQNADDAGATEVTICYDERTHSVKAKSLIYKGMADCHGPALLVHNNASFTDEDFENITKLAGATKMNKPLKIGKFGVGFCSVYHITDIPSFISGKWLYIFDPTLSYLNNEVQDRARPGKKLPFTEKIVQLSKQLEPYKGLFGFHQNNEYKGTLFRFPFRTAKSEISGVIYDESHIQNLVSELQKVGSKLLLFLNNLKRITFSRVNNSEVSKLFVLEKSCIPHSESYIASILPMNTELMQMSSSVCEDHEIWLVARETDKVDNKTATATVACSMLMTPTIYLPQRISGEMFCYLPLSLQTGLPVHVSANFAVLNDRTGIHASDSNCPSEEVEWNLELMQGVVPKAYLSVLLALKELCIVNKVSLKDYEFYSLWPLKECLISHNPWDKMIRQLYDQLSKRTLFYSSCCLKWLELNKVYIISESVLSIHSTEDSVPPDSVVSVLEELSYAVVKLPTPYQSHIEHSEISQRIIDEKQFLRIFFDHVEEISSETRNKVLFLSLKVYATNSNSYMRDLLLLNNCVPCTPNGVVLKMCCKLVDPHANFSELYDEIDGVFPISEFYSDSLVRKALFDLNIIHDLLPWENILERATEIEILYTKDQLKSLTRATCILRCVKQQIESSPIYDPDHPSELSDIAFLPVMKRPKGYPQNLTWFGDGHIFSESKSLVKGEDITMLAGSQLCIVMDSPPKNGGCGTISNSIADILGIKLSPNCESVVRHLLQIVSMYVLEEDKDKVKSWVERACDKIYRYFELILSQDEIDTNSLTELKEAKCVWTGRDFILPSSIAKSWTRNGPFLYSIPHLLVSKEKLITALGIKNTFTPDRLVSALEEIYQTHSKKPIINTKELNTISDIANVLADTLDSDSSDVESVNIRIFYLPDKMGIMRPTEDLAYNDAQWCQIDEEFHFVHHLITRVTALALGVKPVRSKALEQFESAIKEWDGLPFGQREELTLRIQNILNDYPMDITILKELLQNADDAGATKVYFILDKRKHEHYKILSSKWKDLQGPALLVWNDRGFTENDLRGIQKLGLGSKRYNSETIGQYGIGFNVVYHLTDCPSFFTNGHTLCVFDPHCHYVPGASSQEPGRMYENVGSKFWNNWSDMKSCYLRDCDPKLKCPAEIEQDEGTLFRFPLRHSLDLVKQSELVSKEGDTSKSQLAPWKMENYLNEWAPKMKEALLFLKNVRELKYFVINDFKDPSMLMTHHFVAQLEKKDSEKCSSFSRQACQFSTDNKQPFLVHYPLSLVENEPNRREEKWLIQQGIGDILNEEQHWEYLTHNNMKPQHGIAARFDNQSHTDTDNVHKVFCFLPLPLESKLPVHVNGKFVLDAARSGLWQSRDPERPDDKQAWNERLVEAAASSYVNFLVSCRGYYFSSNVYNTQGDLNTDIKGYYKLFPRWDIKSKPEGEMHRLACEVYKRLVRYNSPVLAVIIRKQLKSSSSQIKKQFQYVVDWLPLINDKDPSKQAYFWRFEEETKAIPPILKKMGMQLTVAPLFLRENILNSDDQKCILPLATPEAVFKYHRLYNNLKSEDLPCPISSSVFEGVDTFITFVKYVVQEEHLETESGTFFKFHDTPVGIPLLLTADNMLRQFSDNNQEKVICSAFASVFNPCGEHFLHPDMFKLKLIPSYFIEASKENWPLIKEMFRKVLPVALTVERVRNAGDKIDIQHLLRPLWNCLLFDSVFNLHTKYILQEWALLLSTQNELFSLKSCEKLLPVIPPHKQKSVLTTTTAASSEMFNSDPSESENVFQLMKSCRMPILDTKVAHRSLCKMFCPTLEEHHRILQNFYHLHRNGELNLLLKDPKLDSNIETLFTYFSAIHFAHESNQISLARIKSLQLFKTIDNTYSALPNEALIWPSCICPAGKDIWIKEIKETMVVFLKVDGMWRKLGEASTLGIQEISPLLLYVRFIFPHFHLFTDQDRMKHMLHIRDTEDLFITAWHESQAEADSERKRESIQFIKALKQLPSLLMANQLKPISEFYNPNIKLFSTFLHDSYFPPKTMRDLKWLEFLKKIGLRVKATEEEFLNFCERVSSANCDDILTASKVLQEYLFAEDDWHDDSHSEFLSNVAVIPFVCAENLKHLAWIVPCTDVENIVQKGNKLFRLTSLRMAASFETQKLVWTIKPIAKLPRISYHHLMLTRKEWEAKRSMFYKHLQICVEPECSDVVRNIENVSKSRFSQFKLFDTYSNECVAQKGKQGLVFEVFVECFTYLQDRNFFRHISQLRNITCIPVCSDGSITNLSSPVLVSPSQVIIFNHEEVAKFVPFLNPLPECLHQAFHRMLEVIGVQSEVRFENIRVAFEVIHRNVEQPFDLKADLNTIRVLKMLIKKLYICLQGYECPPVLHGILYLPNRKGELVESTSLLYNDKDNYKSTVFKLSELPYSFISLLVSKFEEISEYRFTLRELYNTLPKQMKPLLLSSCSAEKLSRSCPPDKNLTEFAERVKKALDFPDFAKVTMMMIKGPQNHEDSCERFSHAIDSLCKTVEVFSVPDLTVDVILKICQPHSTIGTAKMDFFLETNSDTKTISLYIDSGASAFTYNLFEYLANSIICFATHESKVDINHLYQPEQAIQSLLKCPTTHEIKEILHAMGISLAHIELSGGASLDVTPKLGEIIPEELHHRLRFDLLNIFRPQEWVAYAVREDHFIFARIEYCIQADMKMHDCNESESNDDTDEELKRYIIVVSEDDQTGKEVSVIDLRKILRMKEIIQDDGSSEIVLYDPNSDSIQLWDAIKDDKLKSILKEVFQELRKVWNCSDQVWKKAIKAMYLKWHPDKNPSPFATKAFQFLLRQIDRREQGEPLEDPDVLEEETSYEIPHYWADAYRRWDDIAASHREFWRRERSTGTHSSNFDSTLHVSPNEESAKQWLRQAECDLIATQTLLREVDIQSKLCAHVCFLAHQVAEKSLKAGMIKLFGVHQSTLKSHLLYDNAYAIEQSQQAATGLRNLALSLEDKYIRTRYPDVYPPPLIPSTEYKSGHAKDAEENARKILSIVQKIVDT